MSGVILTDRLRIFVSSTLTECAEERAEARKAIRSINHDPVLFEDVGARPYPPRSVYKARLESSHIVISIFRRSYGWIDPTAVPPISGIEDEFQIATDGGIDRLVYVFADAGAREPRLDALVERVMRSGVTVAHYSDPRELFDRIRDDVTATVSARFADQLPVGAGHVDAGQLLNAIIPDPLQRFRRPVVEQLLLAKLERDGRAAVTGPLGAGKTVLLATMAVDHNWLFVDGRDLGRLDLLARTVNSIREHIGERPTAFTSEPVALAELNRIGQIANGATLVLDAAEHGHVVWAAPKGTIRLVLSGRALAGIPTQDCVTLPPLDRTEIESWTTALVSRHTDPVELDALLASSAGNPLYLRFYVAGQAPVAEMSLRDLEIRTFESLPARVRELVSYVALAPSPLVLYDLQRLVGVEGGPMEVADLVREARALLHEVEGSVQMVHEHPRATVREEMRASSARLGYFASRLGKHFEAGGQYLAAFQVYDAAGEDRHAENVVARAAQQAAVRGGGAPALVVLRRQSERAKALGQRDEALVSLLSLSQALRQTGAREEALSVLGEAEDVANDTGTRVHHLMLREVRILLDDDERVPSGHVNELIGLREEYRQAGDSFAEARLGTVVSAHYIRAGTYSLAVRPARDALAYFLEVGDDYGARIAKVNLAAALSGSAGGRDEAAALTLALDETIDPKESPRERAVVCNMLTRAYRKSGQVALAALRAIEAIEIGEGLGDLHVIAINRINLGNVRRDEQDLVGALEQYRAAHRASRDGMFQRDEAAANELIASILNEQGDPVNGLRHAKEASEMARAAGDLWIAARADEEQAIALRAMEQLEPAVKALVDAALSIAKVAPSGEYFVTLIDDALSLSELSGLNELKINVLQRLFLVAEGVSEVASQSEPLGVLYDSVAAISRTLEPEHALPTVALVMADVFAGLPQVIQRRVVLQAVDAILGGEDQEITEAALVCVASLLMTCEWGALTLEDCVAIGELCGRRTGLVYFKPLPDGAGHWNIRLNIAGGIVVTVTQLDDDSSSAVTAMIIALCLAGLTASIRKYVIDVDQVARPEVMISVVSKAELDANIDPSITGLGELDDDCVISESTDLTKDEQPPIVVILGRSFAKPWRPNEEATSRMHLVIARLLKTVTSHLLAREVEVDVLLPKIRRLLSRIGRRGDVGAQRLRERSGLRKG